MFDFSFKEPEDLSGRDRIVGNVVVGWLSQLTLIISGFVMPRLIDESIGQEALGVWDFCWSFVNYLNLMSLGIGSSINRYVARYRTLGDWDKLRCLLGTTVVSQGVIAASVVIITVLLSAMLPRFFGDALGDNVKPAAIVVLLLGGALAAQMFFGFTRGLMTGYHRWDIHNAVYAGTSIVSLVLMVLVLFFGGGLVGLGTAYLVSMLGGEFFRLYIARDVIRQIGFGPRHATYAMLKMIVVYGAKSFVIGLLPMVIMQTVNVIVVGVMGPAALAVFARPLALIRHLTTMVRKFTFMLTPMAGSLESSGDAQELQRFVLDTTRFSFAITIPCILILAVMGDIILALWMGEGYANMGLMLVLSLGSLLVVGQDGLVRILMGVDAHGQLALYSLIVIAISFSLGCFIFVDENLDLTTAALLVSGPMTLAYGITLPIFTCTRLGVPLGVYVVETFLKPALCNVPFLLLLLLARQTWNEDWPLSLLVVIVACAVLLALYYWLLITREQRLQLFAFVGVGVNRTQ